MVQCGNPNRERLLGNGRYHGCDSLSRFLNEKQPVCCDVQRISSREQRDVIQTTRDHRRHGSYSTGSNWSKKNKYICYLINRLNENNFSSPKHFIRSLDRLRVLLKAKSINSFSNPLVDPGKRNIRVRELYAISHFAFLGTDIEVKLHTKYYLSFL